MQYVDHKVNRLRNKNLKPDLVLLLQIVQMHIEFNTNNYDVNKENT